MGSDAVDGRLRQGGGGGGGGGVGLVRKGPGAAGQGRRCAACERAACQRWRGSVCADCCLRAYAMQWRELRVWAAGKGGRAVVEVMGGGMEMTKCKVRSQRPVYERDA
eukprot:712315-Rhodomonas_salina.1